MIGAEEAISLEGTGTIVTAGSDDPTPIASLTKMMSALVVLRDHPLALHAPGPKLTITPADVTTYTTERAEDDSVVAVRAGEQLSELQALEGALVPSGDNVIQLLATWDAGSTNAFVAKMNALARSLGMKKTHYAGPSGVNPATVSTASDQLRLAEVAMQNPVFQAIVAMPQVRLPVAGVQYNVDADLGTDGIDGIKTGWVPQGGGCFAFAATADVRNSTVSIIGTVLDAKGATPVPTALSTGEHLVLATRSDLATTSIPAGTAVGLLQRSDGSAVRVVTAAPVSFIAWHGAIIRLALLPRRLLSDSIASGERVGWLEVRLGQDDKEVPLRTAGALSAPSLGWRLLHL